MKKIKILDLFSGIGGFSLGLERTGHFETTAFCEIDKFCKLILDKHWSSPSESDVANTDTRLGNGENEEIQAKGKTSNFSSSRGREDVANADSSNQRTWKKSQQQEGNTSGECFSNSSIDVANAESIGSNVRGREQYQGERSRQREIGGASGEDDVNTNSTRSQGFWGEHELRDGKEEEQTSRNSWWLVEPNVGRVAHGISGRVHRLKALGNSIVPQIVEEIGRAIIEAERK